MTFCPCSVLLLAQEWKRWQKPWEFKRAHSHLSKQNLLRRGKWEYLGVKWLLQEVDTVQPYWMHCIHYETFKKKGKYRCCFLIPHLITQKKGCNKIFDVQLQQVEYVFRWKQSRRVSPLNCILIKPIGSWSVERGEVIMDTGSRNSNSNKMGYLTFCIDF